MAVSVSFKKYRYPKHDSVIQKEVKKAVKATNIDKPRSPHTFRHNFNHIVLDASSIMAKIPFPIGKSALVEGEYVMTCLDGQHILPFFRKAEVV